MSLLNQKIYSEKEKAVLLLIMQKSQDTNPVELSLGYVSDKNQCMHGIVLKSCAHAIINMLVSKGCILTYDNHGIHIMCDLCKLEDLERL